MTNTYTGRFNRKEGWVDVDDLRFTMNRGAEMVVPVCKFLVDAGYADGSLDLVNPDGALCWKVTSIFNLALMTRHETFRIMTPGLTPYILIDRAKPTLAAEILTLTKIESASEIIQANPADMVADEVEAPAVIREKKVVTPEKKVTTPEKKVVTRKAPTFVPVKTVDVAGGPVPFTEKFINYTVDGVTVRVNPVHRMAFNIILTSPDKWECVNGRTRNYLTERGWVKVVNGLPQLTAFGRGLVEAVIGGPLQMAVAA